MKRKTGFARLSKKKRQQMSLLARKVLAKRGTIHKFTAKESARHSFATLTLAEMQVIGRKGGLATARSSSRRVWRSTREARLAGLQKGQCLEKLQKPFPKIVVSLLYLWEVADVPGLSERTVRTLMKKRQLKRVQFKVGEQKITTDSVRRLWRAWRRQLLGKK